CRSCTCATPVPTHPYTLSLHDALPICQNPSLFLKAHSASQSLLTAAAELRCDVLWIHLLFLQANHPVRHDPNLSVSSLLRHPQGAWINRSQEVMSHLPLYKSFHPISC